MHLTFGRSSQSEGLEQKEWGKQGNEVGAVIGVMNRAGYAVVRSASLLSKVEVITVLGAEKWCNLTQVSARCIGGWRGTRSKKTS